MLRPSRRGGVPVLSRPSRKPSLANVCESPSDGFSPTRPAAMRVSPMWIRATKEGAGCDDHGARANSCSVGGDDAGNRATFVDGEILGGAGAKRQVRLLPQQILHRHAIEPPVGLRSRPAYGRSLRAVEHAELNAGAIDGAAHDAVQGVDFANDLPLRQAADCRVAGHLADAREVMGQQQGPRAQPGGGCGCLASGVPAADDDDIVGGSCPQIRTRCFT